MTAVPSLFLNPEYSTDPAFVTTFTADAKATVCASAVTVIVARPIVTAPAT